MAANVESMFYTRKAPWHGLGVRVEEAPESKEALIQAGLDWKVEQTDVYAASGERIPGYKANIRDIDRSVLGIVGDRYKIVQNEEAFAFTDGLLGEGVKYETAGSLAGGKIVWMLAKLPEKYIISGDAIEPYLVFCNSHDGSGAIRVAMTPVRVVCQNTLNLALKGASRVWSARHTGNVMSRMDEARETLQLANAYMSQLGRSINELQAKKLTDKKVLAMIDYVYGKYKYTNKLRASEKVAKRKKLGVWKNYKAAFPDSKSSSNKNTTKKTTTKKVSNTKKNSSKQTSSSSYVWIPRTGSKYHSRSSCSNMKNPSKVKKSDAIARGYEPCSRYY